MRPVLGFTDEQLLDLRWLLEADVQRRTGTPGTSWVVSLERTTELLGLVATEVEVRERDRIDRAQRLEQGQRDLRALVEHILGDEDTWTRGLADSIRATIDQYGWEDLRARLGEREAQRLEAAP